MSASGGGRGSGTRVPFLGESQPCYSHHYARPASNPCVSFRIRTNRRGAGASIFPCERFPMVPVFRISGTQAVIIFLTVLVTFGTLHLVTLSFPNSKWAQAFVLLGF